jgi:excisionase family DNA binding protein
VSPQGTMTLKQVAALYGVAPSTVSGWIKAGKIRPIRLPGGNGCYRFRPEHLEEFEAQCRVPGSPSPDSASESTRTETGTSTGPIPSRGSQSLVQLIRQTKAKLTVSSPR